MSSSTTLDTTVSCKERFNCQEVPYRNTQHCVLHSPRADKVADFEQALKRKLDDRNFDFDFRGVWFPAKVSFRDRTFSNDVNFQEATFNGEADFVFAKFEKLVTFRSASFSGQTSFRFTIFGNEQVKDFDFDSITFDFELVTFEKPVSFRGAIFNGSAKFESATFKQQANFRSRFKGKANFSQTDFGELAEFTNATFEKEANFFKTSYFSIARFDDTSFKLANFDAVTFNGRVNFNSAAFSEDVSFRGAVFHDRALFDSVSFKGEASFHLARFKDYVRFRGNQVFPTEPAPNFREVKFDNPNLVSFHSIALRPFWFVEVDATEFALTNAIWDWDSITLDEEIEGITKNYKSLPRREAYPLLTIACWNLAVNAEENHRYDEASKFRYLAMELRRRRAAFRKAPRRNWSKALTIRTRWFRRRWNQQRTLPQKTNLFWKSLSGSVGVMHWLYWVLSGYGERIVRALVVLTGIWAVFGALYATVLLDNTGTALGWRGLYYSAAVLTLQKPEPHPSPGIAQLLVTSEMILGPVQAALLALAIRRKFMR